MARAFREFVLRGMFLVVVVAGMQVALARVAMAHTGEDANTKHMVLEFGLWGLGVAGGLALVVAVFWVRSYVRRGSAR